MSEKSLSVTTYVIQENHQGRVLVISLGGAGIEDTHEDLNLNLRDTLDQVPYLKQSAGKIDYIALAQKDSADVTVFEVAEIAKTIARYQNEYDGFVVIGGTDTMPFTSAATAFALRGLGKPVIFTGATLNAREWDSDFRLNLPNSVKAASMGCDDVNASSTGEVGVLFDDTLCRATACIQRGTRASNPIITPRVPKIGDVGWTVKFEQNAKPRQPSRLNYSYNTNVNVAYFDLVSECHVSSFQAIVDDPTIQGIIIGAFGAGNTPSKLVPSIYEAVYEKGKAVAVVTNCKKGSSDMGLYDCGALAVKAGAISLGPMMKPAAVEKMRWALSNAKGEDRLKYLQDVARLLLTSVAEEMPENFSRYAVNHMREMFSQKAPPLETFFKPEGRAEYQYDVEHYCKSKSAKQKIMVISMGGTFFMDPNADGSLIPTSKKLGELFDQKLKDLHRFISLDYMELANLDSTEVEHRHRAELAKVIAQKADQYDGFVVLHGTDTLAYSAASTTYMLTGIDKDVIFTGAQRPGFGASDFDRNFIRAIKSILARLDQPKNQRVKAGVKVAFGDKLMLGSTVIKEDEHGINAFAPVEKHQLAGRVSHHVELYDITKDIKSRPFTLFTQYDIGVAYFECISAIDIKQFENYIENPDVTGVLIGGYDEGNMPMQMKYYIATAVNSYNKPVCFISNTDNGIAVPTLEGRNGEFVRAGGIALGDMIKESAFQKLCFAMGIARRQQKLEGRDKIEFVRHLMHTNLAGEISDRYSQLGHEIYKGIFTKRTFTDEEIYKAIEEGNEEGEKSVKRGRGEAGKRKHEAGKGRSGEEGVEKEKKEGEKAKKEVVGVGESSS